MQQTSKSLENLDPPREPVAGVASEDSPSPKPMPCPVERGPVSSGGKQGDHQDYEGCVACVDPEPFGFASSDGSAVPSGESPATHDVRIEEKPLSALTSSERNRLRILTDGTGDSHMLAVLREHPKQALCFLARSESEILGWSLVRWFKPFCERPRNAHLSVFVAPGWRHYGLGQALIEEAVQLAVAHGLVAWVYAGRSDQRDFYRRCPSVDHISNIPFRMR
ncbi:GCN5-related N-acetyltransferase [Thiocapsa marina 5811]|uniref:GCN5-related N-acetyltransferase n=2 Tax=Thiocapsa marina TaxID=244573 RepID=F9UG81_9GAMM|nr:GCN5-related N-acetyltransferase [Thiocapsa marina 5811]